jgi:hypothetical protein
MFKRILEFRDFAQAQFAPIKSFYLKDELNPKIWTNFELDEDIKSNLIQVAEDYFDNLELGDVELEDVVFTGSLANYNWSDYSDFDVHLIFDFSKVDDNLDLVQKYLDAKEKVWKLQHDIKILGFDVELFCENIDAERISTGVYSLMNDEWVVKPTKQDFVPDEKLIRSKAEKFMTVVKEIEEDLESGKDLEEVSDKIKKLWKKIKDSRKAGLQKDGEFSVENLVFKLLRRNGYIQRIIEARRLAYDKRYK